MLQWYEKKQKAKELALYGMSVGSIHAQSKYSRSLICFIKGLLVFMAAFGTIDGFLSAFSIDYNRGYIIPFLFAVSMFVSFLYIHKIVFYCGYFFILFIFTYELIRYYLYANSGYQAIINIIYEEYSNHFNLLSVRQAKEYYDNRYLTITITLVFIGIFLALLLNVTISGYMNVFETALITAPFIEIALYIGKKPAIGSLSLLLIVYIIVAILQCSRNSRMQVKGMRTKEFLRKRTKKSDTYFYQGSAIAYLWIIGFASVLVPLVMLFLYPSFQTEDPNITKPSSIREITDEYVKIFVQTGFTGLLDRYNSNGGLSNGRLGGVSSVRPDFETDLEVTYVPYEYNTLYLKAFTGNLYTDSGWYSNIVDYADSTQQTLLLSDAKRESYERLIKPSSDTQALMEIKNLDADTSFFYLPYYSYCDDVSIISSISEPGIDEPNDATIKSNAVFPTNSTISVTYAPLIKDAYTSASADELILTNTEYNQYVQINCTYVPTDLSDELINWCKQSNLPGIWGDFTDSNSEILNQNEWRLAVADGIRSQFADNYPYTMSPGTTPYNTDFVEYFLFTQKRGYCAHFASSATLLLRTMGIPARYIEGYCIPPSLLSSATPLATADAKDWYQSNNNESVYGVLTVPVSDAYAHAWVEIYLDGYGWIPYEFTPPSYESEIAANSNFLSDLFSGLFSQSIPESSPVVQETDEKTMDYTEFIRKIRFSSSPVTFPVYLFFSLLLVIALCALLFIRIRRRLTIQRLMKNKEYSVLIAMTYSNLTSYVVKRLHLKTKNPLPREIAYTLSNLLPEEESLIQQFLEFTEFACFSEMNVSAEDLTSYADTCKKIKALINKALHSKTS